MNIPTKIRFYLVNGVSENNVKCNKYVIYAHICSDGIYIGMAECPVRRWQEHVSNSLNNFSKYYDDKFREAIRHCGPGQFKHYILAVSNFEEIAKNKEASAIKYYESNLNMRMEASNEHQDYGYRPLDSQISTSIILEKKSRDGAFYGRDDSDRKTIIAEIYMESGRKRVRCTEGQPFQSGLNVECARDERERFNVGDKVRVNVALSEQKGKKYLVAAKTSKLVPVK